MAAQSEPVPITETGVVSVVTDGVVEKASLHLSQAALIVMIAVIAVDIVTRASLNYSFEIADELGGYMLIAVTFFSLAVCQANDGFHRVTFLLELLPPRWRIITRILFDIATILLVILMLVQFWNYAASSRTFGAVAPTYLSTPLWVPQSVMALGSLAFVLALLRTISRNIRTLRSSTEG